jgi:hypothetical protein
MLLFNCPVVGFTKQHWPLSMNTQRSWYYLQIFVRYWADYTCQERDPNIGKAVAFSEKSSDNLQKKCIIIKLNIKLMNYFYHRLIAETNTFQPSGTNHKRKFELRNLRPVLLKVRTHNTLEFIVMWMHHSVIQCNFLFWMVINIWEHGTFIITLQYFRKGKIITRQLREVFSFYSIMA